MKKSMLKFISIENAPYAMQAVRIAQTTNVMTRPCGVKSSGAKTSDMNSCTKEAYSSFFPFVYSSSKFI